MFVKIIKVPPGFPHLEAVAEACHLCLDKKVVVGPPGEQVLEIINGDDEDIETLKTEEKISVERIQKE